MKQLFLTIFSVLLLFGCSEEDTTNHNWNNETDGALPIVFIRDEEHTSSQFKNSTFVTGIHQESLLEEDKEKMIYKKENNSDEAHQSYLVVYYDYESQKVMSSPKNGFEYFGVSIGESLVDDPVDDPVDIAYLLTSTVGNVYYDKINENKMNKSEAFASFKVVNSQGNEESDLSTILQSKLIFDTKDNLPNENILTFVDTKKDSLSTFIVNLDTFKINTFSFPYFYQNASGQDVKLIVYISYVPNPQTYQIPIQKETKKLHINSPHLLFKYEKRM